VAARDITRHVGPSDQDDHVWAERCAYWLTISAEKRRGGPPLRQSHKPLVLTGHGVRLRVDHGALLIRDGFTHYPQRAEERRFFRGERNLPSRIIVVDGSGALSFDVLSWLSEQNVRLFGLIGEGKLRRHFEWVMRSTQIA
jgi:CRISP-associated protein Cas1